MAKSVLRIEVHDDNRLLEEEHRFIEPEKKFYAKSLDPLPFYLKEIGSFPLLRSYRSRLLLTEEYGLGFPESVHG